MPEAHPPSQGQVAYLLLCHKDPDAIIAQARLLTSCGDCVAIHFDARGRRADFERLRRDLANEPRVVFTKRRIRCGWGEWSLVKATLEVLGRAHEAFPQATHFYLISGDCAPLKPAQIIRESLCAENKDLIQSFDFYSSNWIQSGFREERVIYRHFVNERKYRRLFYAGYELQKRLNLTRSPPADIDLRLGAQWWCLRRQTVEKILAFCIERPDVLRFFKTTWIPDETFFQTLVGHLVAEEQIATRCPTFFLFNDYGVPLVFYNDQAERLLGSEAYFARKISPDAVELRQKLNEVFSAKASPALKPAARFYDFQRRLGREGDRFGRSVWEEHLPPEAEIYVIFCRDWQRATALAHALGEEAGMPSYGMLFNAEEAGLPDMGGLEKGVMKRWQKRGAFLRVLLKQSAQPRMIFCADLALHAVLGDIAGRAGRSLEWRTDEDDDFLRGHAQRMGLLAPTSADASTVLALLRREGEAARHALAQHAHHYSFDGEESIAELGKFANLSLEAAARAYARATAPQE